MESFTPFLQQKQGILLLNNSPFSQIRDHSTVLLPPFIEKQEHTFLPY